MKLRCWALFGLFILGSSPALAQTLDLYHGTIHSAFRDTSNMLISTLNYKTNLTTFSDEGDRYLNQVTLTKDENWDPNLTLDAVDTSFNYYDYNTGQNETYVLGTAIAPDSSWEFGAAFRSGAVDPSVANGTYNATLEFYGGDSVSAFDLLASYDISLQVLQKLEISVDMSVLPDTIGLEQTTQLSMTVTNNMTGMDFVSDTWYATGFSNGSSSLRLDSFDGNWFGKTIAPGDNRTDLHSTWSASSSQAAGIYTGTHGVVGGVYSGDYYYIRSGAPTSIGVVPGPGSLIVMGVGLLMGAPRLYLRRKR